MRTDSSGHFDLFAANDSYSLRAFLDVDGDGDARPTPGLQPLLLHGAVLDLNQGDPGSVDITARQVEGQLLAPRSAQPSQREMIVVQQLVQGLGGGALCATPLAFDDDKVDLCHYFKHFFRVSGPCSASQIPTALKIMTLSAPCLMCPAHKLYTKVGD